MAQMKIKFYRQIPGALKFEVQYAEAEVTADPDSVEGCEALDAAQKYLSDWAEGAKGALPEIVLEDLTLRQSFGGPTGRHASSSGPSAPPPRSPAPNGPPRGGPQSAPQGGYRQPQQSAPHGGNEGYDAGFYRKCIQEVFDLCQIHDPTKQQYAERDFVRAASAVEKQDGTWIASSAGTLPELDAKSRAKKPDSTFAAQTLEKIGRFVALLRAEGSVTLSVPKWNRGQREIAKWDQQTYTVANTQQGNFPAPGDFGGGSADDVPF